MDAADVSTVAWAAARLGPRWGAACSWMLEDLEGRFVELLAAATAVAPSSADVRSGAAGGSIRVDDDGSVRARDLAMLLYAFARIGHAPSDAWLQRCYASCSDNDGRLVGELDAHGAANLLWALARLRAAPPPPAGLLQRLASHAETLLPACRPPELAQLAHAAAVLRLADSFGRGSGRATTWWRAFCGVMLSALPACSTSQLAHIASDMARAGCRPSKAWVADVTAQLLPLLPSFTAHELWLLIGALGRFRQPCESPFAARLLQCAERLQLLPSLPPHRLAALLPRLVAAGVRPDAAWLQRYCNTLMPHMPATVPSSAAPPAPLTQEPPDDDDASDGAGARCGAATPSGAISTRQLAALMSTFPDIGPEAGKALPDGWVTQLWRLLYDRMLHSADEDNDDTADGSDADGNSSNTLAVASGDALMRLSSISKPPLDALLADDCDGGGASAGNEFLSAADLVAVFEAACLLGRPPPKQWCILFDRTVRKQLRLLAPPVLVRLLNGYARSGKHRPERRLSASAFRIITATAPTQLTYDQVCTALLAAAALNFEPPKELKSACVDKMVSLLKSRGGGAPPRSLYGTAAVSGATAGDGTGAVSSDGGATAGAGQCQTALPAAHEQLVSLAAQRGAARKWLPALQAKMGRALATYDTNDNGGRFGS